MRCNPCVRSIEQTAAGFSAAQMAEVLVALAALRHAPPPATLDRLAAHVCARGGGVAELPRGPAAAALADALTTLEAAAAARTVAGAHEGASACSCDALGNTARLAGALRARAADGATVGALAGRTCDAEGAQTNGAERAAAACAGDAGGSKADGARGTDGAGVERTDGTGGTDGAGVRQTDGSAGQPCEPQQLQTTSGCGDGEPPARKAGAGATRERRQRAAGGTSPKRLASRGGTRRGCDGDEAKPTHAALAEEPGRSAEPSHAWRSDGAPVRVPSGAAPSEPPGGTPTEAPGSGSDDLLVANSAAVWTGSTQGVLTR
eukprot:22185-Chlamydomonas_euryale.AAC.3